MLTVTGSMYVHAHAAMLHLLQGMYITKHKVNAEDGECVVVCGCVVW